MKDIQQPISIQTIKRLPYYLNFLKSESCLNSQGISAGKIAEALELTEIQVRKDLAAVSDGGRPRVGYIRTDLIADIEGFLGYSSINRAVLVGTGRLGQALLHYDGCRHCGVEIVAAFDTDPSLIDEEIDGVMIADVSKLATLCQRLNVRIGIIAVPADQAQQVCDTLIQSGVLAVWNFAPILLKVPADVLLHNENMAGTLTLLSHHLAQRMEHKENI